MAKISLISKYIPPITVPPLRQRKEDNPLMVQAFIERYSRKLGKQIMSIQKETMNALQDYPWPREHPGAGKCR